MHSNAPGTEKNIKILYYIYLNIEIFGGNMEKNTAFTPLTDTAWAVPYIQTITSVFGESVTDIFPVCPPSKKCGIKTAVLAAEVPSFEILKAAASSSLPDYDEVRHHLYWNDGSQHVLIQFFEAGSPAAVSWKTIARYCLSCPAAMHSFQEEQARLLKRYGTANEAYDRSRDNFLLHFSKEAAVYLHHEERNYIEDLFDQSQAHPDRTAVVDQNGERRTSYAEFVSLIRKTAAKIQSLSLPSGSFILVNMDRCREYHIAMYAIVLAGHAVIPLVPETPAEREAYIQNESESPYIIREDFFKDIASWPEAQCSMPKDSDTAMMLYTSGSTGRPKGVSYSFGMLSRCYQYAQFILEDIDPIIYASSIACSFAAISVDTFHVYCAGGTMHILSDEVRKDIRLMNAYYKKHGITAGNVHPRLHRLLDGGPQLKRIFTSGHRITDFYSDKFETILGYGLAETFSVATYFRLDRSYPFTPVGKAHGGYEITICDAEGNEVPDGEKGEVLITGYLAQGYFKNPELTAETFETKEDGTVVLHTHDIGYKDENGDLILVNRNDMLVKINGMSVNPAEIDHAMSGITGIKESAAKGFTDANGNAYICDFYVTEEEALTPEVLKKQLGRTLMPYMIPTVFVRMERLPQTISSKVDYAALKAPERNSEAAAFEAPQNEEEERLCRAFEKVLGRNRIGRTDDFFLCGGDSLSLIELLAELDDSTLSLSDIAELRTPEKLAVLLQENRARQSGTASRYSTYALTPYQMHYLNACSSAQDINMGSSPFALRLTRKDTDAVSLQRAVQNVLSLHPVFHTRLAKQADGTVIQSFSQDDLPSPEIRRVDEEQADAVLTECLVPISLWEYPLYRSVILETEVNLYLFLDIHHIITDYYSQQILLRDIVAELHDGTKKEDHYPDYLSRMNEKAERGEIADLKEKLLKKYDPYTRHLSFDASQFSYRTRMIRYKVTLKPEEIRSIRNGSRPGVQTALTACTLYAMHQDTNKDRILAGWLYSGRDSAEKMNMAGLMISSLLSAVDFNTVHSPEELLEAVQSGMNESLAEAECSPGSLIGGPFERDLITVNYSYMGREESLPGVEKVSLINRTSANTCIFYIILNEGIDHTGELLFKYNDSVYTNEHIERFISYFQSAVKWLSETKPWLNMTP